MFVGGCVSPQLPEVEYFGEGINGCLSLMPSSSNELSTSVSDSVKCKQTEVNTYMLNSIVCIGLVAVCEVMLSGWHKVNQVLILAWNILCV